MYHHVRRKLQIPFRHIEPTFFSGLLDDPVVLLRNRPQGSNILIDCGQIHHLAKRVLKAVDSIFISHAHMDHFMGLASFARNILVSTRTIDIYGPPGLATRLEHLLAGFDWNLCENFWCSLRVIEIGRDELKAFILPGPEGFKRRQEKSSPCQDRVVYSNNQLKISAAACDHKIPSIVYRVEEKPGFLIDDNRLTDAGLVRGDWLRELNRRYNRDELDKGSINVLVRTESGVKNKTIGDPAKLFEKIRIRRKPLSLGYLCDLGYTEANIDTIKSLFAGVSVLIIECTYAAEDVERARASFHLCTTDVNELIQHLKPEYVIPVHVSKSYTGETDRLFRELKTPPGTTLLRLPDHIVPRPFLPDEIPGPEFA